MKKILLIAILAGVMLTGCGETDSSMSDAQPGSGASNVSITAGNDVDYNAVTVADGGVYVGGDYYVNQDSDIGASSKYNPEDYDPTYSQETCTSKGFFWCPLEGKCLDQPAESGSCSVAYSRSEVIR